jgi:uncharacterized protein YjgD (DUF1641 family)
MTSSPQIPTDEQWELVTILANEYEFYQENGPPIPAVKFLEQLSDPDCQRAFLALITIAKTVRQEILKLETKGQKMSDKDMQKILNSIGRWKEN